MNELKAALLGALQGLTEFLPVSSSGHLEIAKKLFNLEAVPKLFDVILHLATLLAVVIYFRKQIAEFFQVLFRWIFRKPAPEKPMAQDGLCSTEEAGRRTIIAVIITTFITAVLGFAGEKLIPDVPLMFVFIGFFVTSILLVASGFVSRAQLKKAPEDTKEYKGITILQSVVVGVFQGIGTLPGISRSGSTISGSLFTGVDRKRAGEYSFIVSIPAILGAFILELKDLKGVKEAVGTLPLIIGSVSAFVVGYLALAFLMKLIKKGKLEWFSVYLVLAGIFGLIFLC